MSSLGSPSTNLRGRSRHEPDPKPDAEEADDSTYGTTKPKQSERHKKRIAEINNQHHHLQKQRVKELKDMLPESFLEEAKAIQGSNREAVYVLNAAKLYIMSLVKAKAQLQEQLSEIENQLTTVASDSDQQIDDQAPDRAIIQWPAGSDGDETLPLEATPDISPHDSFLRQACEKMIALTKEDVIANNGVLTKKQLDRLNAIHDLMVDMVEDMRKG